MRGILDGLGMLLGITAMLIVLLALVSLANQLLGLFPALFNEPLSLQRLPGRIFAPLCRLMGIP